MAPQSPRAPSGHSKQSFHLPHFSCRAALTTASGPACLHPTSLTCPRAFTNLISTYSRFLRPDTTHSNPDPMCEPESHNHNGAREEEPREGTAGPWNRSNLYQEYWLKGGDWVYTRKGLCNRGSAGRSIGEWNRQGRQWLLCFGLYVHGPRAPIPLGIQRPPPLETPPWLVLSFFS